MLQFPEQISTKITIYPRFIHISGDQICVRVVLDGCFWNDDSISVFARTGVQTQFSVTIFVPYRFEVTGKKYLTPEQWANIGRSTPIEDLDNSWSVNPRQLPLVVKGEFPFVFNWGTSAAVTGQENTLLSANPGVVFRLRDVNEQLFGSLDMRHILLRA